MELTKKETNENLLLLILMIIGVIGFSLKWGVKILELFFWLILSNMILYVMTVIGLIGVIIFIYRKNGLSKDE